MIRERFQKLMHLKWTRQVYLGLMTRNNHYRKQRSFLGFPPFSAGFEAGEIYQAERDRVELVTERSALIQQIQLRDKEIERIWELHNHMLNGPLLRAQKEAQDLRAELNALKGGRDD